jgi:predicted metal-dependent phosphoesterase TrpH
MCPNSTIDLHLHTYYSDGRASPADVLHHAANLGLRTVSITDHDNIHAAQEAAFVADELGLELIPGIELTSRWEECQALQAEDPHAWDIDVLGYFFDPQDLGIQAFAAEAMADLRDRVADCCRRLTQAGNPVNIFDVLDENPRYPGAVPLISTLWHKAYASNWNAAFSLFNQYWREVRLGGHIIEEVIAAIHAAGGVAILAHPVMVDCGSGWLQEDQVRQLKELGLDGLEVYHPRLDAAARAHFLSLAYAYDLLVTGGSDEHGSRGGFSRMGTEPVSYPMVEALRRCSGKKE